MTRVLAFGFPNPFDLAGQVLDGLMGVGGGMLNNAVEDAVQWLVDAVLGALVELSVAILGFFWDAAEPDVGASWFSGSRATPYGEMVVLAAPLLVAFFLAGVIQGVVRGDTAGMVHMALVRLPGAVLAMSVVIAVTDLLLAVTNSMSETVLSGFRDDVEATTRMLGSVASTPGPAGAGQLVLLVFGGIGLLAAVALVIELFVRAGLIYIVVALSPLIYAAAVWEQLRGGVRRLAELGLALILSKFVIAVALSLSAAALVAAWPGGEPTEIATPEAAAGTASGGGSVAQTVGLLVGAVVMFGVAAFMPFVLFRLLPIAEGAMVAQGIKAGPMRAAQQANGVGQMARHNPATMSSRRGGGQAAAGGGGGVTGGGAAGGSGAAGGGAAAGGGGAAGGAAAGGAAAGPAGFVVAGVAVAAKQTVKAGATKVANAADTASSAGQSDSTGASRGPASDGGRPAAKGDGPHPDRGHSSRGSGGGPRTSGRAGAADGSTTRPPRRPPGNGGQGR